MLVKGAPSLWSKCPNVLQRTWFEYELLLQFREENIKICLLERTNYQFLATSLNTQEELEKVGQIFQVAIHFHPSQSQLSIITGSFCALVGLLLTKHNHYVNDSIESNTFFWLFEVALKQLRYEENSVGWGAVLYAEQMSRNDNKISIKCKTAVTEMRKQTGLNVTPLRSFAKLHQRE